MNVYKSIKECANWPLLQKKHAESLRGTLTKERVQQRLIQAGGGLTYSYAAMDADEETIDLLASISAELNLLDQYKELATGSVMNIGEKRMVNHHLLRGQPFGPVLRNGRDFGHFYKSECDRVGDFARKIRSGEIRGSTGRRFDHVVQIGIGGSDLGPRALYLALEQWARERNLLTVWASFISNVDPDDANAILAGVNPETTLFVLVSKSGTTQETLANEALVKTKLAQTPGIDPAKHFVAVTSETSPLARNPAYLESFYIDDYIGGRYSATSAVGGVILSLALGPEAFSAILSGAAEADLAAKEKDIRRNAALLDALLGIFERNVLARPYVAVLPYSQALSRFPAHLQQLDMESNGKQVDRNGKPCTLPTGPAVFGEPGTNGQHSFFQHLHQGTDIVPLQFIGFKRNQTSYDPNFEGSTARRKLNANLAAQIVAFASGRDHGDSNKQFPGGRPSTLIFGEELNPVALGALLAHYENKIMFQGFAWNINSFDQEGVQLGKILTGKVLASGGPDDPVLAAYASLLGAV